MLSKAWLILVLPVCAVGFFLAAYFFFYRGGYHPEPSVHIPFENLTSPAAASGHFDEVMITELDRGTLVIDAAHRNRFDPGELVALTTRVANRGYNVQIMGDFGSLGDPEQTALLADQLRQADSLVVILPQDPYTPQEIGVVKEFVRKGGKLLLIADPARRHDINSLAESFGIIFHPDYLYNLVDYELNFQDIFVREFQPDELTQGIDELVFYSAGSVESAGTGLAFTDSNTRSTFSQMDQRFYPFVRGEDRNVLGLYDLTFMIPPYNSVLDNDRLVYNLAQFLTSSERRFELADFPSFFDGPVDIVLSQSAPFDLGSSVKSLLADQAIESDFREIEDLSRDTVFLGLYEDAPRVSQYLEALGVSVGAQVGTPFTPDLAGEGTAALLLHQSLERDVLVVLADSPEGLTSAVAQLRSGAYRDGLVDDFIGVYKTQ